MKRELRVSQPVEIREAKGGGLRVEGYAAVFGERANIAGMFEEVIERGAFKDAIGRDDVVFLINHDGLPLARTRSGTLTLEEDSRGLRMETVLNADDPDVQNIRYKMERGDLDKMSFAFMPEVEEWRETDDIPIRIIKRAALFDVSIVTNPAYNGTEIGLRSLQSFREKAACSAAEFRARQKARLLR